MMFFQVNSTDSPRRAKKKWLEFCVSTGRMTEFIWQHMLAHLRAITPWKKPSPSNPIHTACEVPIPDCVQRVLSLGPKFATQPQLAPPEMLTLVRQVAKRAPEAETDRCVAEGIQVLSQSTPDRHSLPFHRVVTFFKERSLALLTADKDGGFAVLPNEVLRSKASNAISSVFEFYICCDQCQDWFHGRCVGVLQSEADSIEEYICPTCQRNSNINQANLKPLQPKDFDNLRKLLKSLQTHKMAWPFLQPVDAKEAPDYYTIIKEPMDLQTIERRLQSRHYQKLSEFIGDMTKIFDNCRYYNPRNSPFYQCAEVLEAFFVHKIKVFRESISW
ncbi:hypothetical protein HPB50_005498 [Hyalomma asiaticum]|uniref:Uncharacterized protein n=1 Tax=Hyalomma asiaticum TaxID=266040 RepID=A0ACB7T6F0_HYAAI|nr:hypothetical protein HPB50_005498 [Hyalomma asiaticum]